MYTYTHTETKKQTDHKELYVILSLDGNVFTNYKLKNKEKHQQLWNLNFISL